MINRPRCFPNWGTQQTKAFWAQSLNGNRITVGAWTGSDLRIEGTKLKVRGGFMSLILNLQARAAKRGKLMQ